MPAAGVSAALGSILLIILRVPSPSPLPTGQKIILWVSAVKILLTPVKVTLYLNATCVVPPCDGNHIFKKYSDPMQLGSNFEQDWDLCQQEHVLAGTKSQNAYN